MKGDIPEEKTKGLNKRVVAEFTTTKHCPECFAPIIYRLYFNHTWEELCSKFCGYKRPL